MCTCFLEVHHYHFQKTLTPKNAHLIMHHLQNIYHMHTSYIMMSLRCACYGGGIYIWDSFRENEKWLYI